MASQIGDDWVGEQIEKLKIKIANFEDAVTSLESGAVTEYNLDTGQTVVKVKRADTSTLRESINSMYTRLSALDLRKNGGGATQAIPR